MAGSGVPGGLSRQRVAEIQRECMECEDFGAASIPSAIRDMVAAAAAHPDMFLGEAAAVVAEAAEVLEVGYMRSPAFFWKDMYIYIINNRVVVYRRDLLGYLQLLHLFLFLGTLLLPRCRRMLKARKMQTSICLQRLMTL